MPFFVTLCKTLGKPVNFVPVIDKDVRRWWRSDSLWQAHDERYAADQVCIIPGTQSVAGITRVDEPVAELLDRFEQVAVSKVLASGAKPASVASRRQGRTDVTGPLAVLLSTRPMCCGPAAPRSTRCTASAPPTSGRSTRTAAPHTHPPAPGSS